MIPDPWEFALLWLGTFRLVRLVGWDAITARPREWFTGYHDEEELPDLTDDKLPPNVRRWAYVAYLVRCPWCQGFYVSLFAWAAWLALGDFAVAAAVPLALSSAVGLTAKNLDP